jgi:probable HAF family extracellular repeat protein
MRCPGCLVLTPALLMSLPQFAAADPVRYTVTYLGKLAGYNYSYSQGINASGQITGTSGLVGRYEQRAFLFDGTQLLNLGTLGGNTSNGYGINDAGQVSGTAGIAFDADYNGFFCDGRAMTPLSIGGGSSEAYGINNHGHVVGVAYLPDLHAFFYDGTVHDLGTMNGGRNSVAVGVNDQGEITGWADLPGGNSSFPRHAFLYRSSGTWTDLGTLGGAIASGSAINNVPQVVGYSTTAQGELHAFLWSSGGMTDLGTLGGTTSQAFGVNNLGMVVGYSDLATDPQRSHAFLYTNETMVDLNTLASVGPSKWISWASGINDSAQIAATVCSDEGGCEAVRLDPVPPVPSYTVEVLTDLTKPAKSGSTIAVKLLLRDASGNNISSTLVTVSAVGVRRVSDATSAESDGSGKANPDGKFRFDPSLGGYIFNLSTKGLSGGSYVLSIRCGLESAIYEVLFHVR